MGELRSNRTSNATKIGQTDNWNAELETDIGEIFGIELDRNINAPIFAAQSIEDDALPDVGNEGQVNSDGSVTGVMRLAANVASAAGAAGIEFQSSAGERFKICAVSDNLELYQWNSEDLVWDPVVSLNLTSNVGSYLGLSDTVDDSYVGLDECIPQVVEDLLNPENSYLALVPVSKVLDYPDWVDLVEEPTDLHIGNYLQVKDAGGGDITLEWEPGAGGGGATKFSELDDVVGYDDPIAAASAGAVSQVLRGALPPDDGLAIRPVFTPLAYSGIRSSLTLTSSAYQWIDWQRATANLSTWGENMEGGDMTAFAFIDTGGGDNRYSRFRIPGRFLGLYDVIMTMHTSSTATKPIDVQLVTLVGAEPNVYVLNGRRIVPVGLGLEYDPQGGVVRRIQAYDGPYQVQFQVMIVKDDGVTNPAFAIQAKLPEGYGGTGTRLVSPSSLFVARRC